MRASGHDCAATRRAPPIGTLNIVLGARNGSVSCCSSSAALATDSVEGARAATDPTVPVIDCSADRDWPWSLLLALRPERPRHPHLAVVGVRRHRPDREALGGDAVEQRVVDLGVHREAAVVEALDEARLPQRPVPVEQGAVQPRRRARGDRGPGRDAAAPTGAGGSRCRRRRRTPRRRWRCRRASCRDACGTSAGSRRS